MSWYEFQQGIEARQSDERSLHLEGCRETRRFGFLTCQAPGRRAHRNRGITRSVRSNVLCCRAKSRVEIRSRPIHQFEARLDLAELNIRFGRNIDQMQRAQPHRAIRMALPLAAENELGRQVLAEIDAASVELARLQPHGGEPRVSGGLAVKLDGPREGLRGRGVETGKPQIIEGRSRIVDAEHKAIGTQWTRHNLLAHGLDISRQADELEVVVIEHDRVIDRTERVIPARRNREAELLKGELASVGIETRVDDEMVELQHQGLADAGVGVADAVAVAVE